MDERENESARRLNPPSGGEVERESRETEAREEKVIDPAQARETIFSEAFRRAQQDKRVGKKEKKDVNNLLKLLRAKESGKTSAKEEATIVELLIVLLRYLWEYIKQMFAEEEYAQLLALAYKAGAKTEEEALLWLVEQHTLTAKQLAGLVEVLPGLKEKFGVTGQKSKRGEDLPEETTEGEGVGGGGEGEAEGAGETDKRKPNPSLYGEKYDEFMKKVGKLDDNGHFKGMIKDDRQRAAALGVSAAEAERRRVKAEEKIDEFFEDLMREAEADSRQPWRLGVMEYVLRDFDGKFEKAGAYEAKNDYTRRWQARRHIHNINAVVETGANLEEMLRTSVGGGGRSEDRDMIGRSIAGADSAMRYVEKYLPVIAMDPRYKGHIPLDKMMTGGEVEDSVVKVVAERLMKDSETGFLRYKGRPFTFKNRQQAVAVAEMALKALSADLRAMEYVVETPLPPGSEELRSAYGKGVSEAMNPVKELFERFEMYEAAAEVADPLIEGIHTASQMGMVVLSEEEEILFNIQPTRMTQYSSMWSNWRGEQVTTRQRKKDLALGVQIFVDKVTSEFDEGDSEKIKKNSERWQKAARRLPSRMAVFSPALAWEWREGRIALGDRTRTNKRTGRRERQVLRDGVVQNKTAFQEYAKRRAEISEDLKKYKEEMEKRRKEKIIPASQEEENVKRRERREVLKQEQQRAFLWMVADIYDNDPALKKPDVQFTDREKWVEAWDTWEKNVWKKWTGLQVKLWSLEEEALRRYNEGFQKEIQPLLEKDEEFDKDDHRLKSPEKGTKFERMKAIYERLQEEYDVLAMVRKIRSGQTMTGLQKDDFSSQDVALVERLSKLGAMTDDEARRREEHLAKQQLSMAPFLDDVDFTDTEFAKIGADGYARRYNDGKMAGAAAAKAVEIVSGLGKYKDKFNPLGTNEKLVEDLVEYRNAHGHLGFSDKQKKMAGLSGLIVQNFFRADDWVEGHTPLDGPIGFMLDFRWPIIGRIGPLSSPAQRRHGDDALSMTSGERFRFFKTLEAFVGLENKDKLMLMLAARKRNAAWGYAKQLVIPGFVYLFVWEPFWELVRQSWEQSKVAMGEALKS